MQNPPYASGFLYNLKTEQILLLQPTSSGEMASIWTTLGGEIKEGEEAKVAFLRIVNDLLKINLKPKQIYPIYDYFHQGLDKTNFVFYAEVGRSTVFEALKENTPSWVTFPQTLKLLFSNQTKQDVTVGERVIRAKDRKAEELKNPVVISY